MTKLIPVFIQGKKWIQISQMSFDQAASLRAWLPKDQLKKLTFQGITLNDCLDFEIYECWFRQSMALGFTTPVMDF
ncbi:hypothetical protein CLV31_10269 [Algoriphagus aquaeductus]|jgi:hypothetical protein|uniref:Uncharacterized protein n=1 Tax=Algoriphagus aquaeductus TaxID=475299 RepID=A0A326RXI0_9BACT|nr:hypothetical protein CLV31_10269 [Algoriphagus aquaeductus]